MCPTPVFLPGESQGRGAWWAAIYGVSQSQTWQKWLSSSSCNLGLDLFFSFFFRKAKYSPSSQGYGFSSGHVWMWELDCEEGWALKNWCLWIVVLEKTLESPLDCQEIQSVNPKGNHEYSLEGLMMKLKLQYFCHLMWRTDSLEKTLMLGKIEGGRRRGQQRMRWLMASLCQWTWVWVNSGSWW